MLYKTLFLATYLGLATGATVIFGDHNSVGGAAEVAAAASASTAATSPSPAAVAAPSTAPVAASAVPKFTPQLTHFEGVPDFGFPRCYLDKETFTYRYLDTASGAAQDYYHILDANSYAMRPYDTYTSADCTNVLRPATVLQGHSAPVQLLQFQHNASATFGLPADLDGALLVSVRGSWNHGPEVDMTPAGGMVSTSGTKPIGRYIGAYKIDTSGMATDTFSTAAQAMLTPPMTARRRLIFFLSRIGNHKATPPRFPQDAQVPLLSDVARTRAHVRRCAYPLPRLRVLSSAGRDGGH